MAQSSQKATIAVLPVAGRGTRMLPASKAIAKELMPVGNLPLIAHAIIESRRAGIKDFVIITNPQKPNFKEVLKQDHAYIKRLRQENRNEIADQLESFAIHDDHLVWIEQTQAKGFGHALSLAEEIIDKRPFAVLAPDDFIIQKQDESVPLKHMIDAQASSGGCVVMVEKVDDHNIVNYGVIKASQYLKHELFAEGKDFVKVEDIIEKPSLDQAPSNYGAVARYVLDKSIFAVLKGVKADQKGEIQLTDALRHFAHKGQLYAFKLSQKRYDCGMISGWINANIAAASIKNPVLIDQILIEANKLKENLRTIS
ncbi:MAG: sugar phosphate nucleotidyltransferase [Pseudomonadota bacterium]